MKVNFVVDNRLPIEPLERLNELNRLRSLSWDEGVTECKVHAWIWPLFALMKTRLPNVVLSDSFDSEAINIVTQSGIRRCHGFDPGRFFCVVVRSDGAPFFYAPLEIVQNPRHAGWRRIFMPHLPQPGLIPRSSHRKEVMTVAYAGEPVNDAVGESGLIKKIEESGLCWVSFGIGEWNDFSDVDVLVGVRSFDKNPHHHKPPTKLFNAWLARIPFVGGWDSAYSAVGTPGVNYIRVSSSKELLEALRLLKEDRDLYNNVVESGVHAMEQYKIEKTLDKWVSMLDNVASPMYAKWRSGGIISRFETALSRTAFSMFESQLLRNSVRTWHYVSRRW